MEKVYKWIENDDDVKHPGLGYKDQGCGPYITGNKADKKQRKRLKKRYRKEQKWGGWVKWIKAKLKGLRKGS